MYLHIIELHHLWNLFINKFYLSIISMYLFIHSLLLLCYLNNKWSEKSIQKKTFYSYSLMITVNEKAKF